MEQVGKLHRWKHRSWNEIKVDFWLGNGSYIGIGTDSYGFSACQLATTAHLSFDMPSVQALVVNKNNGGTFAYARTLDYNSHYAISVYGDKNLGFSVRCVKDVNSGN
jgi:uncharacterized protein (TIGR02145 family)